MSIADTLKNKKNIVILAVAAIVLAVVVVIQLMPSTEERPIGPPVITKKARITPPEDAAKAAAPSALPGTPAPAPVAVKKPELKTAVTVQPEEKKPAIKVEAPAKATPAPTAKAERPVVERPAVKKQAAKRWAVHVASMTYENEARHFASKLKKSGYKAYVTGFTKDDVQWYRVRVGFYSSKDDALAASKKIVSKFKVKSTPWIVMAPKSEVSKYAR